MQHIACFPEASRELAQHCPNKALGKSISWRFLLIVAASGSIGNIRATNFERPWFRCFDWFRLIRCVAQWSSVPGSTWIGALALLGRCTHGPPNIPKAAEYRFLHAGKSFIWDSCLARWQWYSTRASLREINYGQRGLTRQSLQDKESREAEYLRKIMQESIKKKELAWRL